MLACVRDPKLPLVLLLSAPLVAGCGEESDPFAEGGETETGGEDTDPSTSSEGGTDMSTTDGTTTTGDGDGDGDTTGAGACAPVPARYVVLGDSVPAGSIGVNGPNDDGNGFKVAQQYIMNTYGAAGLTYENYAVGGAVTADVPENQIPNIPTGMPGHVLVNIHIGGNDLAPFIFQSDQAAEDAFPGLMEEGLANWDLIFAHFNDPANYPDGVTLLVNTQYNPFDDCDATHFGISLSDLKSMLLREYNDTIKAEAAMYPNAYVADQHPVFLGHGHHYDKPECASYIEGADYWMVGGVDFIHANAAGHGAMGVVFQSSADEMYSNCE